MVIDYMNAVRLTEPTANLTTTDIAHLVKTNNVGTEIDDVNLLNDEPAITRAVPSLEFNGSQKPRGLDDIIEDFKVGLPTIAWVGVGEPPFMWKHAVVVTGISRSHGLIHYNEPYKGIQEERSLDSFVSDWTKVDKWLVRLILGRRDNRTLTEWPRK